MNNQFYIRERKNNEDYIIAQIIEKDGMKKRIAKFNILLLNLRKIKILLSGLGIHIQINYLKNNNYILLFG